MKYKISDVRGAYHFAECVNNAEANQKGWIKYGASFDKAEKVIAPPVKPQIKKQEWRL